MTEEKPLAQLYHKDWCAFTMGIRDETVDLVLTDPPYESLTKMVGGSTARLGLARIESEAWDPDKFIPTIANESLWNVLTETYRVLRPNRHAFIMCDGVTLPWMLAYLGKGPSPLPQVARCITEFENVKILVWDKISPGMGYHFRNCHEFILMLDKGKNRRPKDLSLRDIFPFRVPRGQKLEYPTQKPWELFRLLIEQATEPGELVIDPFIGSGTTALAAIVSGREWMGNDISTVAIRIATQRINRCLIRNCRR